MYIQPHPDSIACIFHFERGEDGEGPPAHPLPPPPRAARGGGGEVMRLTRSYSRYSLAYCFSYDAG
jgi:hypothetical protein